MMRYAVILVALLYSSPVMAQMQDDPLAPFDPAPIQSPDAIQPATTQLPVSTAVPANRPIPKDWPSVLSAIEAGDWEGARLGIAVLPDDPIKPYAKATLYTARNSPKVELAQILSLLTEAPDLPQAEQLSRMAMGRGAISAPTYLYPQPLVNLGTAPRRGKTRPVSGDPAADTLRSQLDPYVKVDDGPGAEALYLAAVPQMASGEARAEASNRVAWIYYVAGQDEDARRIGELGRAEQSGVWAAQSAWISGLASWRLGDCASAFSAFQDAARLGSEPEFVAAANFWTARAAQACRRPAAVRQYLTAAAGSTESFYGLLARENLGMDRRLGRNPTPDLRRVEALPNVQRAKALLAMGRRSQAEELLRYQARIGNPADHRALIRIADKLNLAGAQFWLAHFGPQGASSDPADRYPTPDWTPQNGWRVDPALAYAHIIQESNFRTDAVSAAGAVGLMQVRPGTAGDTARSRGTASSVSQAALKDPMVNLDYGQAFIELIRNASATQGQLPKVIAAYNAGPVPVERWTINDRGDPLLWIESIPYWETRFYVPSVLRNMWVIQGLMGEPTTTLTALTEHHWPDFPRR